MSAEALHRRLASRGLEWPGPIESLEVTASTNDDLKRKARDGAPAWAVVLASRQTAGRGRQRSKWVSPSGNLHLSVLLPQTKAGEATLAPLAAGLAVAQGLRGFELDARIKWPNDVLIDERKIAGVLAEASSLERHVTIVVGIGINVNVDPSVSSLGLAATSMRLLLGRAVDTLEVAASVLARLIDVYPRLEKEGRAPLLQAWRSLSVPWWGSRVEVLAGDRVLIGRAVDVDENGALLLQEDGGTIMTVLSGQARQLRQLSDPRR